MKKTAIVLSLLIALLAFASCASSASERGEDTDTEECFHDDSLQYTKEDLIWYLNENAFDCVSDAYFLSEILEMYEEQHPQTFQDDLLEYLSYRFENMPNMALIMEELAEQEQYSEYEQLFQIADKIGYNPSAIVGAHCLEVSTNVIHLTNSSCLSEIDFSDMYFICETSEYDLVAEMDDDDKYLQDCILCETCWFGDIWE